MGKALENTTSHHDWPIEQLEESKAAASELQKGAGSTPQEAAMYRQQAVAAQEEAKALDQTASMIFDVVKQVDWIYREAVKSAVKSAATDASAKLGFVHNNLSAV